MPEKEKFCRKHSDLTVLYRDILPGLKERRRRHRSVWGITLSVIPNLVAMTTFMNTFKTNWAYLFDSISWITYDDSSVWVESTEHFCFTSIPVSVGPLRLGKEFSFALWTPVQRKKKFRKKSSQILHLLGSFTTEVNSGQAKAHRSADSQYSSYALSFCGSTIVFITSFIE